jgi:hypothetical protein
MPSVRLIQSSKYSERKTGMALPLTMPVMALMLFAPVLPFRFPLLNLSVRDRNHALCQPFETLEWRSGFPWL